MGYSSSPSLYAISLSSDHFFFFVCSFSFRSTQIKTYSWDDAQVILVGNKCDMEDERVVSTERGRHLGEQLGKGTSARRGLRVVGTTAQRSAAGRVGPGRRPSTWQAQAPCRVRGFPHLWPHQGPSTRCSNSHPRAAQVALACYVFGLFSPYSLH